VSAAATGRTPDGGAIIAPGDVQAVTMALGDGMARRGPRIGLCRHCRPGRPCPPHACDAQMVAAWRTLKAALAAPPGPAARRRPPWRLRSDGA
jgi:hypothetical protein